MNVDWAAALYASEELQGRATSSWSAAKYATAAFYIVGGRGSKFPRSTKATERATLLGEIGFVHAGRQAHQDGTLQEPMSRQR